MLAPLIWLGYIRVSRVGGRDETLISPDVQARRIEAYASMRGYEVEVLAPELNVSGARVSRPILDAAITRIERGEAAGIIVADLSRLSRMSMADALATLERIESVGGQVVSVAENVDPTSPEGRMARNMFLSVGEMQRGQYRRHTMIAKRQAVERGVWPTSTIPRGYAKGSDRRLIPGPDAGKVRRGFELRASGASWRQVADALGSGSSGAARTIRNRVYLGEVRLMIDGEQVVNRDAHPPLVSRDLFEAAQIAHPAPARGRGPSLLAGLIRCAHCSQLMTPGDGVYRCFPRKVAGRCPSPAIISKTVIEPHVEEIVLSHLRTLDVSAVPVQVGGAEQTLLEEAESELAAFQEAVSASGVGAEHVASGLRSRVEAVEAASAALGALRAGVSHGVSGVVGVDAYLALGVDGRRHVLRRAIGVVWVRKGRGLGRVKLVEAGEEPSKLSRPGSSVPLVEVAWDSVPGEVRVAEP